MFYLHLNSWWFCCCFVFCVCVRVLLFLLYNKIYVCAYLEMYNLAEVVIQLIICVYSDVLFLFVFQLYRHFVICISKYLGFIYWWGFFGGVFP